MRRLLAAAATVVAFVAYRLLSAFHPPTPPAHSLYPRGAYHLHTQRSDGLGTVDAVAEAAAKDGLDFIVVTDHNLPPLPAERRHGVLVVYGEERSTADGHEVELQQGDRRYELWAHPLNRRVPWRNLSSPADGMEVLSGDDLWRDALRPPFFTLLQAFWDLPFSPIAGAYDLMHPPEKALATYDEQLRQRGHFAALCAIDAHGFPPYSVSLRTIQIHLPKVRLTGDPGVDSQTVIAALVHGNLYCGLDAAADADGLRIERQGDRVQVLLESAPPGSKVTLFCDGSQKAQGPLPLTADLAGLNPESCRIEVTHPLLARLWPRSKGLWILTGQLPSVWGSP